LRQLDCPIWEPLCAAGLLKEEFHKESLFAFFAPTAFGGGGGGGGGGGKATTITTLDLNQVVLSPNMPAPLVSPS